MKSNEQIRFVWTENQKKELESTFQIHKRRPPKEECVALSNKLNAPIDKIHNWFGNRTTKYNKEFPPTLTTSKVFKTYLSQFF